MTQTDSRPSRPAIRRRPAWAARPLQLVFLLALASCGGGSSSPGGDGASSGGAAGGAASGGPASTGDTSQPAGSASGAGGSTGTPAGGSGGTGGGATASSGRLVFKPVLTTTTTNGASTYDTKLYVFDPLAPSAPVSVTDLGTDMMAAYNVYSTRATAGNRQTLEYKDYGDAMVFFVNGGRLWKIDLSAGVSHDAVALSSLTDVCAIGYPTQISADGLDAWVPVSRAGSGCGAGNVGATYVRATMSPTDAPVELPSTAVITTSLDDGELNALGMLLDFGGRMAMYDRNMAKLADVSGAAAPTTFGIEPLAYDYKNLQAYYFQVGSFLQRLTWTASGAQFEAPIYTFAPGNSSFGASDPSAYYFADGSKVMKVEGAGVPSLVANVAGDPVGRISMSATDLVLWQGNTALTAVRKSDGAVTPLAAPAHFLGVTDGELVYTTGNLSKSLRAINLDGTQDRPLGAQLSYAGVVARTARVADQYYLESVLSCVPSASGDDGCSNGELQQIDIASGAVSVLGTLAHSGTYRFANLSPFINGDSQYPAVAGSPAIGNFNVSGLNGSVSTGDLYLVTPGTPASLVQLTHDVP